MHYKHFGPVIDESLKRGHKVFCFHNYAKLKQKNKMYQFPSIETAPRFSSPDVIFVSFNGDDELVSKIRESKINVLVSLSFLPKHVDLKHKLEKIGVAWVAMQCVGDSLAHAELWIVPDLNLMYSTRWIDLAVEGLLNRKIISLTKVEETRQKLRDKSVIVGFSELEQIIMFENAKIKKDWGIPVDKKVVLFLPFPFQSSADRFWKPFIYEKKNIFIKLFFVFFYPILFPLLAKRRPGLKQWFRFFKQVIKKENDFQLVKKLKKFCEKNNAYLLVKSRKKDMVKPYMKEFADKILYDEDAYPSTIIKCLAISDLCCNFYSSTVLEASFLGVPNICISPNKHDLVDVSNHLWKIFLATDLYNFPGVSYKLGISEAIKAFSEKTFADFPLNKEKQKEYVEKYVGPKEGGYSTMTVKALETLVNKRKIQ